MIGLAFFLAGFDASAGPVDCGDKPIRVGQFKLGFRYYVEDGQEKGMNKDILDELRKRTGCSFVSQEMPFARIWADLGSGDLDMTLSGIRSPERDKTLWCAPSIATKNMAVIRTASAGAVKNAEDFLANGKLIFGVVRGYTHGAEQDKFLEKMRQAQRVEESASVDILFEKLKLGRVDGIFAFPFVYRKWLPELKIEKETAIQDWAPKDKGIIGCTMFNKLRFSEEEATRWRKLIDDMRKDGTLKRIFIRYVTAEEADRMLDF